MSKCLFCNNLVHDFKNSKGNWWRCLEFDKLLNDDEVHKEDKVCDKFSEMVEVINDNKEKNKEFNEEYDELSKDIKSVELEYQELCRKIGELRIDELSYVIRALEKRNQLEKIIFKRQLATIKTLNKIMKD